MRIGIMSDLHIEFDRQDGRKNDGEHENGHPLFGPLLAQDNDDVDFMILAGDIDIGVKAVEYAAEVAGYLERPVVLVAGNHEFYGGLYGHVLEEMKGAARQVNGVHFLENGRVRIAVGGRQVRVLGASLWTDYALNGGEDEKIEHAKRLAGYELSDHHVIRRYKKWTFRPDDALTLHLESRAWLEDELSYPFAGQTVVVTHHAPSGKSIPTEYQGQPLSSAFASSLDELVAKSGASLWVHGHTHRDADYIIDKTRVISRQRGYPGERPGFTPKIVEI